MQNGNQEAMSWLLLLAAAAAAAAGEQGILVCWARREAEKGRKGRKEEDG